VKQAIFDSIVSQLEAEIGAQRTASRAAHAAATDEESKPENQYDTRALEAGYLAQAQSARVDEAERMLKVLKEFPLREHAEGAPIVTGSLVHLESDGAELWYFLLPYGAGIKTETDGKEITVVSHDSPLGRLLLGKRVGDSFTFRKPGGDKEFEILDVA
jgi:transcription elongation GreA/GreB family factor